VVGAQGPAGRAILRELVGAAARGGAGERGGARIGAVLAIDSEPVEVGGTQWRQADPGEPSLAAALQGVDTAVYVATRTDLDRELAEGRAARRQRNLRRAQTVITSAAAAGVGHLIVVTSAKVFGARPDNPVPLDDEAPLRAVVDTGTVGDLIDVEQLAAVAREVHPGLQVTVVRPAALVGDGVDTVITRHFEAPRLLTVKGARPTWQFCHVDDLGSAIAVIASHRLGPALTVACDGWLTQDEVERLTGMRRVELSLAVAQGTADRLHRVGLLPTPSSDLAFVVHPWAVASGTLRAHGWEPAYDNATCLGVLLDGIRGSHAVAARRLDRKDAALGAASAAVAMVGTAAIMRRKRRKGGGA
jgi:nucleoside-diphosphate-sugar epimerase